MKNHQTISEGWSEIAPDGRLLRPKEVMQRTGLSRSQVYAMISAGEFPPFIKLSVRASAMPEAWLNAYIADRARQTICERYEAKVDGARHV